MIREAISAGIRAVSFACLLLSSAANADNISIGVNVGTPPPPAPPPPVVVAAPPRLAVVPGTPVYYAPGADINLFVYGGRYYSFHNGTWFFASAHNGQWVLIAPDKVPKAVRGVPVTYYKIPPGQAKKMGGPGGPEGHGKGPKGRK